MRHFGLIGRPLGHSLSAKLFSEKFSNEGIDAEYSLYELATIGQVQSLIPRLSGFNVTIPYKQAIIPYLSDLSEEARRVGAVNCVRIDGDGRLHGYNTDVLGIRASLNRCSLHHGDEALLLGATGGAAAAVRYVLEERGINVIGVSRCGAMTYNDITAEVVGRCKIIVNATPVGMSPHIDECPAIPYDAIGKNHILFDLIYNPVQTEFLRRGAERGAQVIGGMQMFLCQAEASWQIWNER